MFDKNFVKFSIIFSLIIVASIIIVIVTKAYGLQNGKGDEIPQSLDITK